MQKHAPENYDRWGNQVFNGLEEINKTGDQLGGWDRLGEVGGQIAEGHIPTITAEDKANLIDVGK